MSRIRTEEKDYGMTTSFCFRIIKEEFSTIFFLSTKERVRFTLARLKLLTAVKIQK